MTTHKKFRRICFAAILLILPLVAAAPAQQTTTTSNQSGQIDNQDEVLRVDTNLVTIPASVMDRDGRYITDLKKEDFQIFEDGIEQEVAFFEPTDKPFTILFLVDVSSSMSRHRENLWIAVNALASKLRPHNQLMVASFFQWTDLVIKPTRVSELNKSLNLKIKTERDCPTYLYNAVDDALKRMKKIRGRKAIVLFSDGEGSGYGISARDTLREAIEQEAIIYTFKFGTYPTPSPFKSKKIWDEEIAAIYAYLRDLAQTTGGRNYQIEEITDLQKTFGSVAEELSRQYTLGYYPKQQLAAGQTRQIKVKVLLPNLAVRARDSYLVQSAKNR